MLRLHDARSSIPTVWETDPEKEPACWQKYSALANGAAGAKAQDLSEIFGTAESRCPDTNLCIGVLAKLEVDLDGAAVSNILRLHA